MFAFLTENASSGEQHKEEETHVSTEETSESICLFIPEKKYKIKSIIINVNIPISLFESMCINSIKKKKKGLVFRLLHAIFFF